MFDRNFNANSPFFNWYVKFSATEDSGNSAVLKQSHASQMIDLQEAGFLSRTLAFRESQWGNHDVLHHTLFWRLKCKALITQSHNPDSPLTTGPGSFEDRRNKYQFTKINDSKRLIETNTLIRSEGLSESNQHSV